MNNNQVMTRLKILVSNLIKKRPASMIIISGFSASIAIVLVLIAFLINEFSVEKGYSNIDRIYRVFSNSNRASVREDFPEMELACRSMNYRTPVIRDDVPFSDQMISEESSFLNILSSDFLIRDRDSGSSLIYPNDLVITGSFAKKSFVNDDLVDKTPIQFYDERLNTLYENEQKTTFIIRVFAIISIILSSLATFGVIHFIETKNKRYRCPEGTFNKSNSYNRNSQPENVNVDYNCVLDRCSTKAPLNWWIFTLAGLFAMVIALFTIRWQSWRGVNKESCRSVEV